MSEPILDAAENLLKEAPEGLDRVAFTIKQRGIYA